MAFAAEKASEPSMQAALAGAVPRHVAIIMDGNGRWAKSRGLPRTAGHKRGAETLRGVLDTCRETGVKYLTIYAFSSENWKRPPAEVADLMQLLKLYINRELKTLHENRVRLRFIGDRSLLSNEVRALIQEAEMMTQANADFFLTVALSYGSRQELSRAVQAIARAVLSGSLAPEAVSEETIAAALDTHELPEPDLLIRTGGEQRLSNFLLWQSAYTELYFTPTLWPDFSPEHFRQAIGEFARRERRYGNAG